ncbi:MAG: hypothetical protein NPINA01_20010 [Nitrospinaceae bacterium]|nr:MAG: hypothetical protein NPINA01_20010 [Nitrospinaceae bacterium]
MPLMAFSKDPNIFRKLSCVSGQAPSKLMETRLIPEEAIFFAMGASINVPFVAKANGTFLFSANLIISQISGRTKGSPPLRTRIGEGSK